MATDPYVRPRRRVQWYEGRHVGRVGIVTVSTELPIFRITGSRGAVKIVYSSATRRFDIIDEYYLDGYVWENEWYAAVRTDNQPSRIDGG